MLTPEEIKIPIETWDGLLPKGKTDYLKTNRLFLKRFEIKHPYAVVSVVLNKYDDSVIVKL